MLNQVNAAGVIDPISEMHYRFHQHIDPSIYPQVHDFYELTLVTDGSMDIEVNGEEHRLPTGALILLRPGDVHTRRDGGGCKHINLAFHREVIGDMFRYLDEPQTYKSMAQMPQPPIVQLPLWEMRCLQERLGKLNFLPVDQPHMACVQLRRLMLDIIMEYIVPELTQTDGEVCPRWLRELLEKMEDPANLCGDLDMMAKLSGYTREHVCRSFRRYLGQSPTEYLNAKRLNYAANLLRHTDKKVIDIAYGSGFQSLSRFYHAFRAAFQTSPREYRRQGSILRSECDEKERIRPL